MIWVSTIHINQKVARLHFGWIYVVEVCKDHELGASHLMGVSTKLFANLSVMMHLPRQIHQPH